MVNGQEAIKGLTIENGKELAIKGLTIENRQQHYLCG
jgi:hypothetical protein